MFTSQTPAFTFEFSLTVLNHLGRQLYRNFITVLGEAISNAWDADATEVRINIERDQNRMRIQDDGRGMNHDDIQNKFLKIGYSKRKNGNFRTPSGRPSIGAKGIGKLALLSCADTVTVISRKKDEVANGCIIDNGDIDEAIDEDKSSQQVTLATPTPSQMDSFTSDHGTVLIFDKTRLPNSTDEFLRKALALFFRFTLVDPNFTIIFNDEKITISDAQDLAKNTQYLWKIGEFSDPFLNLINAPKNRTASLEPPSDLPTLKGFLATVKKPNNLKVFGANETIGVDLFVNGRLRERTILRHRPSARVPAQYLYGQIHLDMLDDGENPEPFTSSREAVLDDNEFFIRLLDYLHETTTKTVFDQWDEWRLADKQDGDDEFTERRSEASRASDRAVRAKKEELLNSLPSQPSTQFNKLVDKADAGISQAAEDYSALYLLENLLREVIKTYEMPLNADGKKQASTYRKNNDTDFEKSELEEPCRAHTEDEWFASLNSLLNTVENRRSNKSSAEKLDPQRHAMVYLRNIVMHTAGLTRYGHEKLHGYQTALIGKLQSIIASEENKSRKDSDSGANPSNDH